MSKKTRWFVLTNFNCNTKEEYQKVLELGQIRYLAYGAEVCPSTKKKHHQMFVYFNNLKNTGNRSLNNIGKMFGKIHCNVEPMYGSVLENESYCSKESELFELGDKPKQGVRSDIKESVDMIVAGEITPDDICIENPIFYHQYGRTLEKARAIGLRRRYRTEMTQGIWIWGESSSGKSHEAFKDYDPSTHYVKNLNEEWWDGYMGQSTVIFNEFRGSFCKFSELLDLVDKWPKNVKWRNRESVPFLAQKLIITCICEPRDCYSGIENYEDWEQFNRRFTVIKKEKYVQMEQKCSIGNNETIEPFFEKWKSGFDKDYE